MKKEDMKRIEAFVNHVEKPKGTGCITCKYKEVCEALRLIVSKKTESGLLVNFSSTHRFIVDMFPNYTVGREAMKNHIERCEKDLWTEHKKTLYPDTNA